MTTPEHATSHLDWLKAWLDRHKNTVAWTWASLLFLIPLGIGFGTRSALWGVLSFAMVLFTERTLVVAARLAIGRRASRRSMSADQQ